MRWHFGCVHSLLQSHGRFNVVFASHFVNFKLLTVSMPYVLILEFRILITFIINLNCRARKKTILDLSESFTTAVGHRKLKGLCRYFLNRTRYTTGLLCYRINLTSKDLCLLCRIVSVSSRDTKKAI